MAIAKSASGDGRTKLAVFFREYVRKLLGELGHCVLLADLNSLNELDRHVVTSRRDAFEKELRALIRAGQDDGSIVSADPRLVDFLIMGAINWIPRWYNSRGKSSPDAIADSFVSATMLGLAPREA
jgi:TetR/AcrR family transcriptional regulator